MASYEIEFPTRDDDADELYTVREMAYCDDHFYCCHEPQATGRVLLADGTWGRPWDEPRAAVFACLYDAEEALRTIRQREPAPEYVPLVPRCAESGDVTAWVPAHEITVEHARRLLDRSLCDRAAADPRGQPARAHLRWLLSWSADRTSRGGPREADHWAFDALLAVDVLVDAGLLRARADVGQRGGSLRWQPAKRRGEGARLAGVSREPAPEDS